MSSTNSNSNSNPAAATTSDTAGVARQDPPVENPHTAVETPEQNGRALPAFWAEMAATYPDPPPCAAALVRRLLGAQELLDMRPAAPGNRAPALLIVDAANRQALGLGFSADNLDSGKTLLLEALQAQGVTFPDGPDIQVFHGEHTVISPRPVTQPPASGGAPQGSSGSGGVPRGREERRSDDVGRRANFAGVQRRSARQARRRPAPQVVRCGNCNREGHGIDICAHPSTDGLVYGCPFCNVKDHWRMEDCPKDNLPTNLSTIVRWAVTKRACRPPLAMFNNWAQLLRRLLENEAAPRYFGVPDLFPWTENEVFPYGPYPWENFDYAVNDPLRLHVSGLTKNMKAIKENWAILHAPRVVNGNVAYQLCAPSNIEDFETRDPRKEPGADGEGTEWAEVPNA